MAFTKAQERMKTEAGGDDRFQERDDELEIDMIELFYHLLEKAKIIVLAAVLGAIIAGVYTFEFVTPKYTATSKLYILNDSGSVINLSDLQIGSQLANDYIQVFSNWHVHELVNQRLGLNYSYRTLSSMVNVTNPTSTRILFITVTSADPKEAQDMANAYCEVAREFIAARMGTAMPNTFETARLPSSPSSPNKTRNIAVGLLLGALLAGAIIVIQFLVDDRVRSADIIEKRLHLAVLGMMPVQQHEKKDAEKRTKHQRHDKKKGGEAK